MAVECCRTRLSVIGNNVRLSLRTHYTLRTVANRCGLVYSGWWVGRSVASAVSIYGVDIETCIFVHNYLLLRHKSVV